jgi:hypothetical protein
MTKGNRSNLGNLLRLITLGVGIVGVSTIFSPKAHAQQPAQSLIEGTTNYDIQNSTPGVQGSTYAVQNSTPSVIPSTATPSIQPSTSVNLRPTNAEVYGNLGVLGFTSQDNDSTDTRLIGYGSNLQGDYFVKFNCPKGAFYVSGNMDFQKYDGDMSYLGNKIANFNVSNNDISAVLGYIDKKTGIYTGLGWDEDNRTAKVDLEGFDLINTHNENYAGAVINAGCRNKKWILDGQYINKVGDIKDSLEDKLSQTINYTNNGRINDGSEIKVKVSYNGNNYSTSLEGGKQVYKDNGTTESVYYGVNFYKKLSNWLKLGFGINQNSTGTKDSEGNIMSNNTQTQISFGLKGFLEK